MSGLSNHTSFFENPRYVNWRERYATMRVDTLEFGGDSTRWYVNEARRSVINDGLGDELVYLEQDREEDGGEKGILDETSDVTETGEERALCELILQCKEVCGTRPAALDEAGHRDECLDSDGHAEKDNEQQGRSSEEQNSANISLSRARRNRTSEEPDVGIQVGDSQDDNKIGKETSVRDAVYCIRDSMAAEDARARRIRHRNFSLFAAPLPPPPPSPSPRPSFESDESNYRVYEHLSRLQEPVDQNLFEESNMENLTSIHATLDKESYEKMCPVNPFPADASHTEVIRPDTETFRDVGLYSFLDFEEDSPRPHSPSRFRQTFSVMGIAQAIAAEEERRRSNAKGLSATVKRIVSGGKENLGFKDNDKKKKTLSGSFLGRAKTIRWGSMGSASSK